jgi:hypothetical protein
VPDLDQQLRNLIDGAREPIQLHEILTSELPSADQASAHRRWARPLLGAAAALLVVAAVAVIVREQGDPVSTTPSATTAPATDPTLPPLEDEPRVVIGPTEVGDLTISTSPLVPADGPECLAGADCYLWLQHELIVRNDGDETIYIDDTRTSELLAGDQILVGDEGCGYASNSEGGDVMSGVCTLNYMGTTLEPGESHAFRISLWRDLPGMEPLTSPAALWERELRFDTRPLEPGQERGGTVVYIDIGYLGLVPAATSSDPAEPGVPVEVTLWHCGIDTLTFEGQEWEVPNDDEPFDGTNAPAWFAGRGTIVRSDDGTHLVYTDETGFALTFVPDDGVEPPCA